MKKIYRRSLQNLLLLALLSSLPLSASAMMEGRLGVHWGLGKMSNELNSIPDRTMNTLDANAWFGWRMGSLMGITYGEYRIVGQNTKASEVSNTNLKGSGFLVGLGLEWKINNFYILGAYSFLGNYSLSKPSAAGLDISYSSPSGFHVNFGYLISPVLSIDFVSSLVSYSKTTVGTTESNIDGNALKHYNAGIGFSLHF